MKFKCGLLLKLCLSLILFAMMMQWPRCLLLGDNGGDDDKDKIEIDTGEVPNKMNVITNKANVKGVNVCEYLGKERRPCISPFKSKNESINQ